MRVTAMILLRGIVGREEEVGEGECQVREPREKVSVMSLH